MPPHGGHGHHGGGGGRRGGSPVWWGGYPSDGGGDTTVVVGMPGCMAKDPMGRLVPVPCTSPLGDTGDAIPESDGATHNVPLLPPAAITRTALNVVSGRKRGGSTPYYSFAAQAKSYPFDWNGRPGGVPQGHRAGESSELSGGGDLLESGLNPYAKKYGPLDHRAFRIGRQTAFSGVMDLSDNEKILAAGAVLAGAFLLWRSRKRRKR